MKRYPRELGKQIEHSILKEFERIRPLYYSSVTKGYAYEIVVKRFLREYFDSVLSFDDRVALLDADLKVLSVFTEKENEFDVVACYKNAVPCNVLTIEKMKFIPYDGCALVVEVAQTLTKKQVEDDIAKFSKLSKLVPNRNNPDAKRRFGTHLERPFSVLYPLRVLFYYDAKISDEVLSKILSNNVEFWDILVVIKSGFLVINANLPIVIKKKEPHPNFLLIKENAIMCMLHVIGESLVHPIAVNARKVIAKLIGF